MSTDGRMFVEYRDCGESAWILTPDDGCEFEPLEGKFPDLADVPTSRLVFSLIERCTRRPVWMEYWHSGWQVFMSEEKGNMLLRKMICLGLSKEEALYGALENVL